MSKIYVEKFRETLVLWYRKNHRKLPWRETQNSYFIWISEVMLQQTQVKTVLPYFEKFTKEFPSITDLAEADLQTVLKMWEGLGYYARARNFHKAAKIVTEEFSGKIPSSYDEFRKLPGVGEYIGAAVQSIAFGHSYAVVDGNVKRVLARLFNITAPANDTAYLKTFQEAANEILDTTNPGDFNQAMMELGATICRPQTPLCDECPISQFCWAFEHHSQDALPIKKQKKKSLLQTHNGYCLKNV